MQRLIQKTKYKMSKHKYFYERKAAENGISQIRFQLQLNTFQSKNHQE